MEVSKSQYATMRERSASAVSHWIRDGVLSPPALKTNDDGDEMIVVEIADQQLAARLDPSQQFAQVRPIVGDDDDAPIRDASDGALNKRYLAAKAEAKELEVEEQRRKMALANGKYIATEEAEAAWGRQIAGVILEIDGWIGNAAREVATELQLDERAIGIALRKSFRAFRERQAAANAAPLPQAAE